MIPHSQMELNHPTNYANSKLRQTKPLTHIAKCKLFVICCQNHVIHSLANHHARYYEGGVSSVFLWEQDDGGFAGVVLLKKCRPLASVLESFKATKLLIVLILRRFPALTASKEATGSWDSIHVFEANERGRSAHYKLTSTIMLQLVTTGTTSTNAAAKDASQPTAASIGTVDLSGMMTRQVSLPSPALSIGLSSKCSNRILFVYLYFMCRSSRIARLQTSPLILLTPVG